jgi:outer membrane receptor for ferrienterochelin and colicins
MLAAGIALAITSAGLAQPATPPQQPPQRVEPVEVSGKYTGVKPNLREDIVKTESLSAAEIERSGASNLAEALDKHPGVNTQVECSICNVRNVVLNNLPGRFTTLMIDGVPIFSAVSSAYGLDMVGISGVERIDIARGAGTSLITPEALAGSVNVVTRRPKGAEATIQAQLGNFGYRRFDFYGAVTPSKDSALVGTFQHSDHKQVDANGDGISEYTGYKRTLGGLAYFVDRVGPFNLRGRVDIVDEKRNGGAIGRDYQVIKEGFGDGTVPFDFSRGPNGSPNRNGWVVPETANILPWTDESVGGGGRGALSEIIFTQRFQTTHTGEGNVGAGKLRFALGYAEHKQDSYYEGDTYIAKQKQYYLESAYKLPVGATELTVGANYRYEDLASRGILGGLGGEPVANKDSYKYTVPGFFLQAYRSFGAVEAVGSVRYDRHNVFGGFLSPRLNVLISHSDELSSRIAAGRGFRAPTSFFEQDHGILGTVRIDRQIKDTETSNNLSYALNYADERLAATVSYNYNRLKNAALLNPDAVDEVTGDPITLFTAAVKPVTVTVADATVTYKITPRLTGTAAIELSRYKFDSTEGALPFARPKQRAYFTLDYETDALELTAKAVWTGKQDLFRFHGEDLNDPTTWRYNFDGTPKLKVSPTFWTLDLRAAYNLSKNAKLYAGIDNVTDYTQAKKENFLFVDYGGGYDVVHLWGPSRGRFVYGGLKYTFR